MSVDAAPGGAERTAGPVLPGMPNLHSHAFQRAMAGSAQLRDGGGDSFWSWRELMYGLVRKLTPEHLAAIAAQVFAMLMDRVPVSSS